MLLQQARWMDGKTIALPANVFQTGETYRLTYAEDQAAIDLTTDSQWNGYQLLRLPDVVDPSVVKGELAVVGEQSGFKTGVQLAGVLDDWFYFGGKLGAQFPDNERDGITVAVWAPTARTVKLLLFHGAADTNPAHVVPMLEAKGVWSVEIENTWRGQYYLFSVTVYVPKLGRVVENIVTDPYSVDLALNGSKSRLTDLHDAETKPEGWDLHRVPELRSANELTIWELHVRDFSAGDESVPAELRGTYLAFTQQDSNGMRHIRRLAEAGLKAIHLLPTFHIYSVNEDKNRWKDAGDLSKFPPDGVEQQAAVAAIKDEDGFNWGYDPVHFMTPAGSYAVQPDLRVKEYRAMVQALHGLGLQVIQDQVFNHTCANGQSDGSVLDKIVPGYYHRLDDDGNVMSATCCSDTASERLMMEKLMVDALVQNAEQYGIDGYRFDLMGYHYVSNMRKIQAALGPKIYLYGEGWGAAATGGNPDLPNATQQNLYGLGIGTFNDGMRDGIRGGNPFSDSRDQGFATGIPWDESQNRLVRAGLAGNIRDLAFENGQGQTEQSGYTASPVECISYCSVHDNQVLFDAIQLKAPAEEDAATRARRQVMALSLIALGQGIPFFHAGDEILRSKSMDQNSYNSGDWFNRLDFTYESNNWGVGLPMASENELQWPAMRALLANPALKPSMTDIRNTLDAFEALLRVRTSSGLFCMQTLNEVQSNLRFERSEAGVIAMSLQANQGSYHGHQSILVVFNALKQDTLVKSAEMAAHPAMPMCGEYEAASGGVRVNGLTTGVFIQS